MSPLKRDVVAGREHCRTAFTVGHLAAAEDSDLDDRPFSQLAQQFTAEVVGAIVERDDWSAAQEHRANTLLGFLGALRGGDHGAEPAGRDHGDEIDQIALAGPGRVGVDKQDRCCRQRSAHQRSQQAGERDRAVELLVPSNENSENRSVSNSSAARACSSVGCSGIGGNCKLGSR